VELWRGNSLDGRLGSGPKLWGGGSGQPVKGVKVTGGAMACRAKWGRVVSRGRPIDKSHQTAAPPQPPLSHDYHSIHSVPLLSSSFSPPGMLYSIS
jgi:hypothetical protein